MLIANPINLIRVEIVLSRPLLDERSFNLNGANGSPTTPTFLFWKIFIPACFSSLFRVDVRALRLPLPLPTMSALNNPEKSKIFFSNTKTSERCIHLLFHLHRCILRDETNKTIPHLHMFRNFLF